MVQDFDKVIRAAFDKSGLSMLALARRANLRYGALHRYLTGKGSVTSATLAKLCNVLGLELRPMRRAKKGD